MIRGLVLKQLRRAQVMFAAAFTFLALVYITAFNIVVHIDPDAAESRFHALMEAGAPSSAGVYGERVLKMRRTDGVEEETLAPLKAKLASAHFASGNFKRGASLYEQALSSRWIQGISSLQRAAMEDDLARAHIAAKELDKAVEIYALFLNGAGDEAARGRNIRANSPEAFYADRIQMAADLFAEALKPTGNPEKFPGAPEARLAAASKMAELGAFYAMREDGVYAAAGLLASSYEIRRQLLGGDHQDTVQITLILGPVYTEMGRLANAEKVYLDAFHAQEKSKGANSPDLSLYLKLLVDIYQKQGRTTEAQALYEHMHNLFRDAFGEQRYAANRARNRKTEYDRPVSQQFVLDAEYAPNDLVRASDFSVPVSKDHNLDEMKLRRAADSGAQDPREQNLPARLAQLISLCRSESGERISLRSGYRSFKTQHSLFSRNGARGKTAPPGMSEHQSGLAVDIDVDGRLMRRSDRTYQCFEENAYQYGFILSYPPGNNYLPGADAFEPWHWRYV
ncbi:MAG: D-alanyl-D-alanine carboxypeptidase family protein, partial [Pseudomonadota bacterium]